MLVEYSNRETLFDELADRVAEELSSALSSKGWASLSVPGGTTPQPLFERLSEKPIDWAKITVCLNDERIVPVTSDRSNTALVKESLLKSHAASAEFMNILTIPDDISDVLPLDVLVSGMGTDLHTASLFPDAPELARALAASAPPVLKMTPPSGGEDRVTLTAPVLGTARNKHILITGPAKKEAFRRAEAATRDAEAPIRVVLIANPPAMVHYAE
ncbi:MAG: 6-phosphogluconolactonase [Pseudomonadota bacterium]